MQRLSLTLGFCALLLLTTTTASAGFVNGKWINDRPHQNFGSTSIYRRPFKSSEKVMSVYDWRMSKLPRNHKGIEIGATTNKDGSVWAYRWIGIWHCEISDAWRDGGIHTDFIRIYGGGTKKQDVPTTVVLQDIYIHDGNALPIIIQDGEFDKITLKDIRVENVANSPQLVTINCGSMKEVFVENCPNLRVTLCGRPNSIGVVYVKNSPGCVIVDALNKAGRSGAKIVYQK
jgi:hypothetical protein